MDMNRLPVDDGSAAYVASTDRTCLTHVVRRWHRSIRGHPTKKITLEAIDLGVCRFAKPGSALGHGVKHRLDIGWRPGNNPQDFARGRLLFASFGEFAPQ